jgi:hypothetical protein
VYSDGGSLYTFAIAEDETQSQEVCILRDWNKVFFDDISLLLLLLLKVAVENDDAVMDVGSLYNPNDMDSHYYSLQRVGDDSTIAAPIALFQQPETSAKSFRHKQPTFKWISGHAGSHVKLIYYVWIQIDAEKTYLCNSYYELTLFYD